MMHVNHRRELEPPMVRAAIRRIRDTDAVIRTQAPLFRNVNDKVDVWSRLWTTSIQFGMIP